jgi:hypothetical protein
MSELIWSMGEMILAGVSQSNCRKTSPGASLPTATLILDWAWIKLSFPHWQDSNYNTWAINELNPPSIPIITNILITQ